MRNYITIAMIAFMAFAISSCGKPKAVRELASKVEATNEKCPMRSELGVLNSVEYDEEDNVVTFNYEFNAALGVDISVLRRNINLLRSRMLLFIVNPQTKGSAEDIIAAGATMELVYRDATGSDELEVRFTPQELKDALANPMSDKERAAKMLEYEVLIGKANCPAEVDEVTTLVDVSDDGTNLIYSYTIDETDFDMSDPDYDALRQSLLDDSRSNPAMRETLRLLVANGKGLVYSYRGSTSGKTVEVKFSASELR